jgi:uncharacterized damage-inducible protein DinB
MTGETTMRKILLLVSAALCLGSVTFGQALSAADRDRGVKYLEETRDAIVDATKGLSEAQWKFKAATDRWSVAETLEHIALSEDFIFGQVKDKIMQAPAGAPDRDTAKTDAAVLAMIPDRSHKAQAPPPLLPTGRWSPQETLRRFLQSRAATIEYMKTNAELRAHVADSPLGMPLDGYEWLLFIGAHSQRHTKQILEVQADPGYPKS